MYGDHGSQQDQGDKKKYTNSAPSENKPCRPITIRQLYTSEHVIDAQPVIDGKEIDKVTIVGRIIGVSGLARGASANAKEYTITDGTGQVVVKDWLNNTVNSDSIVEGNWVTTTGTVKQVGNSFSIIGSVSLVEDQNEVTYHFLEACLVHARLTDSSTESRLNNAFKDQDGSAAELLPGLSAGLRRDRTTKLLIPVRAGLSNSPNGARKSGGGGGGKAVNPYQVLAHINQSFSAQQFADCVRSQGEEDQAQIQSLLNGLLNDGVIRQDGQNQYSKTH